MSYLLRLATRTVINVLIAIAFIAVLLILRWGLGT